MCQKCLRAADPKQVKRGFVPGEVVCPHCGKRQCEAESWAGWSVTAPETLAEIPADDHFMWIFMQLRKLETYKAGDHYTGFDCEGCGKQWVRQDAAK